MDCIFRGDPTGSGLVAEALASRRCVTCGPVLLELRRGMRSHEQERVLSLLSELPYLECTRQVYEEAGEILSNLRKRGYTIPSMDGLIAAIATTAGIPLLTLDSDFELIPELELYSHS